MYECALSPRLIRTASSGETRWGPHRGLDVRLEETFCRAHPHMQRKHVESAASVGPLLTC